MRIYSDLENLKIMGVAHEDFKKHKEEQK